MLKIKKLAMEYSPFCVGIDLRPAHVPEIIQRGKNDDADAMLTYGKICIDAAISYSRIFKFQIACYEAFGLKGMKVYSELIKYAKSKGAHVIGDVKRGDIGSTAELYADAHFTGDFEVDTVTLSPFMGEDAISPYYRYFKENGKSAFLLAKTSNPSSRDFQDLMTDGEKLYSKVLAKIAGWADSVKNGAEFSPIGAVVAVNEASDIDELREACKELFLLVPGYGAQGAKLEDLKRLLSKYKNGIVSVSRAYTANLPDLGNVKEVKEALSARAKNLAEELKECYV